MINNFPFYPQPSSRFGMGYPQNIYKNLYNHRITRESFSNHSKEDTSQKNKQRQNSTRNKNNLYNYGEDKKIGKSHSNKSNILEDSLLKNNDSVMFELFGIKLFQDDILLICLIFFLYNEGIKDEFLFVVLILLLLS